LFEVIKFDYHKVMVLAEYDIGNIYSRHIKYTANFAGISIQKQGRIIMIPALFKIALSPRNAYQI